ncbi:MAG: CoB--CoM heterodisulfide reductase iron-sulfur subunit A family protein [Lentimicrobium sp.]|jgi:heterodisulfide reductase subunit A|nr:CoB--CoM heterodisulfide reductase iron-sulfur subunit A family protein [Lentimicrobium sp.]
MKKKIGVYICHCGGNISDYVDVEKVKKSIEDEGGVYLAKTTMFACSDSNQKDMVDDIKGNELNGIVVASCSPKLHLTTFRNVSERADLNKYNYVHANIREQDSWAHSDDKNGATEKAILLVKAAIAKARLAEPLIPNKIQAQKAVAVIGGGIAGMKAAIALSDKDCPVYLIEKAPFVGGRVAQWGNMFTSNQTGEELITKLYHELIKRKNITLFTGAEVTHNAGSIGDFRLKVSVQPRYFTGTCEEKQLQQAIDACPVEVLDEFNFNLTKRKAIYRNAASEYPQTATIDMENCTRCGKCEAICDKIDLSQKEEILDLHVGSVLMATGFDPYTPAEGEYGYNEVDNVLTLPQFVRMLELSDKKLIRNGKEIKNIAYIYCVGSRQEEDGNTYCSRYCCTSAIHTSVEVKKKFPGVYNYHFNRGIRTYGKQELLYAESLQLGDIYLQGDEESLPEVSGESGKTMVKVKDILSAGRLIEVEADLVVLVTGMVPRADNSVGSMFKLPKGRDKFFNEIHMKLRPVETFIDGVTIAGACQGPKNIMESVNSALAAATKSYSYVSKGELETEPIVAEVDAELCSWCDACAAACPFDAISMANESSKAIALINNSVCKGCGMCLPVCPTDALNLIAYSNNEIESMIDALAAG